MIEEKLKRNIEIRQMIVDLNTKIKGLKYEKKMNDIFIFKHCEHEWVLAPEYFQYDERPNKCKKCNLVRN